MNEYKPIAELNNFIVLDRYNKYLEANECYQTEADLESEFINDLKNQGYEYVKGLTTPKAMLKNIRVQLENLNNIKFSDSEWKRFCEEYLDKPSDNHIDKTHKIHNNHIHDFTFDDGHIQNIYLLDKKNILNNKL